MSNLLLGHAVMEEQGWEENDRRKGPWLIFLQTRQLLTHFSFICNVWSFTDMFTSTGKAVY